MPFNFFNPDNSSLFPSAVLQVKTYSASADIYLVSRDNGYMITGMLHNLLSKYYRKNSPNVLIFRIIGAFYEIVKEGGEFLPEEFHPDGVRELPFIIQERPIDSVTLEITLDIPNEEIWFNSDEVSFTEIWRGQISEFLKLYSFVDPRTVDPNSFRLD